MAQDNYTNYPHKFEKESEKETKTADEVINEIAEVLREERIANQILTKKVKYIEDSIFEVDE
ncbi:MAG TPA: hypothetical protein PJ987_12605 [Bacteroidia bacterium]|nr:hypothetical protein [Bacteroidia bacterium]HMY42199.1 hypothetical protein [Chitinophagales bacterium]